MMAFTRTWNAAYEADPENTDDLTEGASKIRQTRVDARERLEVDHSWAGDANDGAHKKLTLLEQASDPANVANTGFVYTKDDGAGNTELYYEDHAGNVFKLTAGGALNTTGLALLAAANIFTKPQVWGKGADIASAATLTLGSDGNAFDVTGTTTITAIADGASGAYVGMLALLHFDGALVLTHHATDLILPGGANITTAAGDIAVFEQYATDDWRCVSYQKADGTPVVASQSNFVQRVIARDATVTTFTATIPDDDTKPQNTEGAEIITVAVTPGDSTNRLRIRFRASVEDDAQSSEVVVALFQDSAADALKVTVTRMSTNGVIEPMALDHEMAAGGTSEITFKIRVGFLSSIAHGTGTINGVGGARKFGGALEVTFEVDEVKA